MSGRWLSAAAVLFLACVFLHQPVTDFCDYLANRFGFLAYDHGIAVGFLVAGVAAAGALTLGRQQSATTWASLMVLFALVVIAQRVLILNSVENVHFPQYAVLAALLVRTGLAPDAAWVAASALGVADEEYQYLFLRAGRPDPLDWNDITLNAIGAALGVVVLLHFGLAQARIPRYSWRLILAVMAPLTAAALWLAPPVWSPFYKVAGSGFRVHVLSPAEGLVLVGALWLAVYFVVRRVSPVSTVAGTPDRAPVVAT
jgi:hypothetical protein